MATIDYSSGPRVTAVGDHVVYTKATWAASWTAQPNLTCVECQWQAAPHFASALLVWRTGSVILPGASTPTPFTPWTSRGHFVRIDWACEDSTTLRWVGYIDSGSWPTEAFGDQHLVCYGLERALALTPILDHVFKRTTIMRSPEPPVFDFNRSAAVDVSGGVYLFYDTLRDTTEEQWTTREIVRYLLKYHVPTGNFGVASIPWSIDQVGLLPDWDRPTIETRGKTVWDVLNELVHADRQLGFTVGSDGSTAYLRVFTHTASDITVGSHTLLANPNQHTVVFAPDALTMATLSDVGGGYDQVICRGAKRQSICTLSHNTQLEDGWSSTDETTYEAGASGEPGYATLNTETQRARNSVARSVYGGVDSVYKRWKLSSSWDFQLDGTDVFPDNTNPKQLRLLPTLPIDAFVDWSGTVDPAHLDRDAGRPLFVLFANPDDLTKYVDLAKFALRAGETHTVGDLPHDCSVSAEASDLTLRLKVQGAPQHAIAGANFTKLPVDTMDYGGLDYTTMKLTVALEEDRYCEGKYPAVAPTSDIVRRLFVDCGPAYQQVRIHGGTIAGIGPDGAAKTVTASAYLVDDSARLQTLAQLIALGAVLTRKRVHWSSLRRISTIAVGDMITTAGGATVLAPVTSVRIHAPPSVDRPSSCPTQAFETYSGSQDPLNVLRQLGAQL
jgi:hypothetical protein